MPPANGSSPGETYLAPRLWALVAGLAVALVPFIAGTPHEVVIATAVIGGLFIAYFIVGYIRDPVRPKTKSQSDEGEPPGGWSTQGPYLPG
jgi:hypothetical protein